MSGAFAAAEPPDYPADKCPFLWQIPYDFPADPYSDYLVEDMASGRDIPMRLYLKETFACYWINGTNYTVEDIYLTNAWCPHGYFLRDVPLPSDQALRTGDPNWDHMLGITDPLHGMEYGFYEILQDGNLNWIRNAQGYYQASSGDFTFLNMSGSGPTACSLRGPSIALSVGLIRPGELAAGTVDHALAFSVDEPSCGICPPAAKTDGCNKGDVNYPDRVPEAALIRLKPSVFTDEYIETLGWTHTEKTLARAARDYGFYVTDHSNGPRTLRANSLYGYPEDPYAEIPGAGPEYRTDSQSSYVRIWGDWVWDPAYMEVMDTIYFPYQGGHQHNGYSAHSDYDGDGVYNSAEIVWGYHDYQLVDQTLDPTNGPQDWDNDGLTNAQESQLRSHFRYAMLNPFDADSDGDGYTDYEEGLDWSADPTNPFVTPDAAWPGMPTGENLALMKPVSGSDYGDLALAVDGDDSTCAASPDGLAGTITVDLGASCTINRVVAKWLMDYRFPAEFNVQVSPDNQDWNTIATMTGRDGGIDDCYGLSGSGRYVKLEVTETGGFNGMNLYELEVYGSAPTMTPVADFRGAPTIGNPPLTVDFTDLSNWTPTSWSWNFGDGGTSGAQNPSHQYTSANSYTVSLTATNSSGQDTESKTDYITVTNQNCHVAAVDVEGYYNGGGAPSSRGYYAEATVTVHDQNCAPKAGVTVDIIWTGNWKMVNLTWEPDSDVTDGNGQVTFTSPTVPEGGLFRCCVDGLSLAGYPYREDLNHDTCTAINNPPGQAPIADFQGSPTEGPAPLTVNFSDQSTGNPTDWDWTFGDGGTSEAQHPSHEYTTADSYTVGLTAYNDYGQDTETKTNYITVTGTNPPVADFSGNPTQGEVPLTVNFSDLSTGSPTDWDWTFGDGGTSEAQHPSHEYTTANTYTVGLTAYNEYGQDTETKTNYITVTQPQPPVADFEGSPLSGPAPLTVNFSDLSTNNPTDWDWTFGDGGTSDVQHPSHQYTTEDSYTVSLTAYNAQGDDTETKVDYITVTGSGTYPANSYSIVDGTPISGGLSDIQASDDSYLVVESVKKSGKQRTVIEYYFDTGLTSVSSLTFSIEWHYSAGAPEPQPMQVKMWNYDTSGMDIVGDWQDVYASEDVTVDVPVANPDAYVSSGGEAHAWVMTGNQAVTWTQYIDLVKVTAAP